MDRQPRGACPDTAGNKGRVWRRLLTAVTSALLLAQPALAPVAGLAATIQTDLFVYQNGDTVTVTGDGFGPSETVDLVTVDPVGAVVDQGTAASDAAGNFSYQFVLNTTFGGLYTVTARGETSAVSASTQFDPQDKTVITLVVAPSTATWGTAMTASGTLTDDDTKAPIAGATVTLGTYPNVNCNSAQASLGSAVTAANGTFSASINPPAGTPFVGAAYAGEPQVHQAKSQCTSVTVNRASTSTTASLSPTTIPTSGTTSVSWSVSSAAGVSGFAVTGGTTVVKDTGPGTLSCTPASVAVNTPQTNSGFSVVASSSQQFTCSASANGAYTLHVHFADTDGNYFNSDSAGMSLTVSADVQAPSGTVSINGGATVTNGNNASLHLIATDNVGVTAYRVANGSDCTGATFQAVTPTPTFDLTIGSWTLTAGDGAKTVCAQYRDAVGNSSAVATANITVDTTGPVITFAQVPNGSNGWFKTSPARVTVTATDTDDGGVATLACTIDGSSVSLSNTGSTATTRSGDVSTTIDGHHLVSCTASDPAGNPATASTHLMLDTVAPIVTASASRPPNANGWYNGALTVSFSASDATSDNVGAATFTFQYDGSGPIVTATPDRASDSNGWYNHALTVTFSATDATSDRVVCDEPVTYGGPDAGTATVSGTCTDAAGNVGSGSYSFKYDATAPAITFVGQNPGKNAKGWNNSDVTLSWNCSDALSGVASASVSKTITSEGSDQSETGTCQDLAGNSASSTDGHVKLDKTKPTISFSGQSPAANAKGWNKTDVTLSWTCADGLSGVVSSSDAHLLP